MLARIDVYNPAYDTNSHAVQVHGYADNREYSRSSVQHPTGYFENQSILAIAQALGAPLSLIVSAAGSAAARASEVIPKFQVRRGLSTPWDEMMRLLPQRGMTIHGDRYGNTEMIAGSSGAHAGGLIQGKNILRASAQLSDQNLAQVYGVIGQAAQGYDSKGTQVYATAPAAGRGYFEFNENSDTDQARAQQHAIYRAARAGGEAAQATISAPTWRDDNGDFWSAGKSVFVYSPFLKIENWLTIMKVVFDQDGRSGTVATLTLQNTESVGGETLGGSSWQGTFSEGGDQGTR